MSGFTQIPNILLDRTDLDAYEHRAMLVVARKTMGWGKQTDGIPLSQFMELMNAAKNTVLRSIEGLEEKGIIEVARAQRFKGRKGWNKYRFSAAIVNEANKHLLGSADEHSNSDAKKLGSTNEPSQGSANEPSSALLGSANEQSKETLNSSKETKSKHTKDAHPEPAPQKPAPQQAEQKSALLRSTRPIVEGVLVDEAANNRPASGKATLKAHTPNMGSTQTVLDAYAQSYAITYNTMPLINARTGKQARDMIAACNGDVNLAVDIADYYPRHKGEYYVKNAHGFALMLKDVEKLATEMRTGRQITATRARQSDKGASNADALRVAMEQYDADMAAKSGRKS